MEEKEKRCRFLSVLWANMFSRQYYLVIYIYIYIYDAHIHPLSFVFPFYLTCFFSPSHAGFIRKHTHTYTHNKYKIKKREGKQGKKKHIFFLYLL